MKIAENLRMMISALLILAAAKVAPKDQRKPRKPRAKKAAVVEAPSAPLFSDDEVNP